MYGLQIAFRRFNPTLGIMKSPWVGFTYFEQFFNSYYFRDVLFNTVSLSVFTLFVGFPAPIFLALVINEIKNTRLKKAVQNITYMPNFLSVVVIVSMIRLHLAAVLAGCFLDLCFGDPRFLWHPVCGIGSLISWLEKKLRKRFPKGETGERRAGLCLVILVLLVTGALSGAILWTAYFLSPYAGFLIESVMCGQMMACSRKKRDRHTSHI